MGADGKPKPFWKRKRWIGAAVVWLAIVYPVSLGPLDYLAAKQQLPAIVAVVYRPLLAILETKPGCRVSQASGLTTWRLWWLSQVDSWWGQFYDEWKAWPSNENNYDYFLGYGRLGYWGIRVQAVPE